jgi:hypothetical protein
MDRLFRLGRRNRPGRADPDKEDVGDAEDLLREK